MKRKYDYLLFDIGGVLLEHSSGQRIIEWMDNPVSNEEMSNIWLFSETVRKYERGLIKSKEFAEGIVKELQLNIDAEAFLEEFAYFPKGLFPGVEELIKDLSNNYSIACFSNTNELHWSRLCDDFYLDKIVDRSFLSFKIGFMKPDPEAYNYVINALSCEPCKIIFFDDNKVNVEAAKSAGMDAVHVLDFSDMKKQLLSIGILENK